MSSIEKALLRASILDADIGLRGQPHLPPPDDVENWDRLTDERDASRALEDLVFEAAIADDAIQDMPVQALEASMAAVADRPTFAPAVEPAPPSAAEPAPPAAVAQVAPVAQVVPVAQVMPVAQVVPVPQAVPVPQVVPTAPPAPAAVPDAAPADQPQALETRRAPNRVREERGPLLISSEQLRPDAVEQYRRLAATLHQTQAHRGTRVFICTSAVAGEGKTVTACNLAMTLSQSYRRRVLLIDADLRHPKLHHLFNVPNSAGLSDGLLADRGPALSVHVISDTLSLLTAGPRTADPMSLLISDRMRRVLAEAASRYDWVILDTPPALLLPDANLLAGMVDTSVLVVGAETTPYRQVRRAVEVLGRERILGLVLNRAHDHALVDSYGYPASYPASTGVRI